jgi:hypothetical protein
MFSSIIRRSGITFGRTFGIELVKFVLGPIFAAVDPHRFGEAKLRLFVIPAPER